MTPTTSRRASRQTLHGLFLLALAWPHLVAGQVAAVTSAASQAPLSVEAAFAAARLSSADLAAARAAVEAARGRERQAAAITNPAFSYATEKTAGSGLSNRQHITALEQPIELGGQRGARRDAARSRREAEEANLALAESNLRYDVTLTYAKAAAMNRRAALALEAASEFERAVAVSAERMASGDISGYAHRRLRLEATRYAVLSAEANLERATARRALASLVGMAVEALPPLPDSIPALPTLTPGNATEVAARASAGHPAVRAAQSEAEAARADARLVRRDLVPSPSFTAGYKREETSGVPSPLTGFVAGFSLPFPLWDRRAGARETGDAEAARREAAVVAVRRRIALDAADALDAYRTAAAQRSQIASELGAESRAALRAAQVAYAEGEITLVEWLDAVRAYRETEASFALLEAEVLIRRAALERALGTPIDATPRN